MALHPKYDPSDRNYENFTVLIHNHEDKSTQAFQAPTPALTLLLSRIITGDEPNQEKITEPDPGLDLFARFHTTKLAKAKHPNEKALELSPNNVMVFFVQTAELIDQQATLKESIVDQLTRILDQPVDDWNEYLQASRKKLVNALKAWAAALPSQKQFDYVIKLRQPEYPTIATKTYHVNEFINITINVVENIPVWCTVVTVPK